MHIYKDYNFFWEKYTKEGNKLQLKEKYRLNQQTMNIHLQILTALVGYLYDSLRIARLYKTSLKIKICTTDFGIKMRISSSTYHQHPANPLQIYSVSLVEGR